MRIASTKLWLFIAILIVFVVFSIAYSLLGYKWPVGTTVTYYINTNTAQVVNEGDAVMNAASSWSQVYSAGLQLSYGGSTSETTKSYNSSNTVCWNDEGENGVLATAYIWYSGETIIETDMVFNDYYNWSTSGSNYDIETVALHEFGHWVGLDHVSTGIMRPSYSGIQRSIDGDAEDGFNAMYGGGDDDDEPTPSIDLDRSSLSFTETGQQEFYVRNSGEGTLSYQVSDNGDWISVSPESGSSTGEWDEIAVSINTSGLEGGDYSGTVSITSDNADNSPQAITVFLTIASDQPPSVSIVSPSDGDTVSKEVIIEADVSDDNGISKVEFYIDGVLKQTLENAPYNYTWDTVDYSNGLYTIKVKAYDTINQIDEDTITVTVHHVLDISITSPSDGDEVTKKVTIKTEVSSDYGVSNVEFYVDGVLKETLENSPYNYTWDTVDYSNGSYTIKVKAYDTINQVAEDTITVTVHHVLDISITSPQGGDAVSKKVTIKAVVTSDYRVTKVEFYIDGVLKETLENSPYTYKWNTEEYSSTLHTIKVKTYDTIDQTAQDTITVTVDQPPEASITSPSSGDVVSERVTIKASASDDIGISKVEFYIDGVLKITKQNTPYSYEWDTVNYSSGSHTAEVLAYDTRNQTAQDTITVTVDQPPEVSITSPSSGDVVSQKVTIKASVSDDYGVSKVEFYIDGVLEETLENSPYSYKWNTLDYSSTSHTIKVKAYDTINQTAEDAITVIVDQPPEISITSPLNGNVVSGKVAVEVEASDDNGISKVEFYIDGILMRTKKNSPFSYEWNTASYSSGLHTIKVKAFDTRNQTAEDTITITVDQLPEISITSPSSGSIVSGNVFIQASGSDDIGINKVDFYINGEFKNTDTESPYDYNWDTTSVYNGAWTVKAVVYDTINQTDQDEIEVIIIPKAPLNLSGTKYDNSSLLLQQFVNVLTWQANRMNKNINKYRIYQIEGGNWNLLAELDIHIFEYLHKNVEKDNSYYYALVAVDNENREGLPAQTSVQ